MLNQKMLLLMKEILKLMFEYNFVNLIISYEKLHNIHTEN